MTTHRTVTVSTRDHGPATLACPEWCAVGHSAGPVRCQADVAHTGLELPLTVPSPRSPAKWLHACVDVGPLSTRDRAVGVVVEIGDALYRLAPASLRVLVDSLAAQLGEVRAYADRVECVVTGWGVPSSTPELRPSRARRA